MAEYFNQKSAQLRTNACEAPGRHLFEAKKPHVCYYPVGIQCYFFGEPIYKYLSIYIIIYYKVAKWYLIAVHVSMQRALLPENWSITRDHGEMYTAYTSSTD